MTRVRSLVSFAWDFVVGDDWRIAVAVAIALVATLVCANNGIAAWWLLPAVVIVMLTTSVWAAARARR